MTRRQARRGGSGREEGARREGCVSRGGSPRRTEKGATNGGAEPPSESTRTTERQEARPGAISNAVT